MAYLEKENLVEYIMGKYKRLKGFEISPLKLQKTLYLLYGMWAGNALNMNENNEENQSEYFNDLDPDLFTADFQAWTYGPVDYEVYTKFKEEKYTPSDSLTYSNLEDESIVSSFVESITDQTFEINDFALVDLTHKDNVWKNNYHGKNPFMSSQMSNDEIKEEYKLRLAKNGN